MVGTGTKAALAERTYALFAYTSAVTIVALGGYVVSLMIERTLMTAAWQIVLAGMAVPLLAAVAVAWGNNREYAPLRTATWWIVAPLGLVNPLTWLGLLVILIRAPSATAARQHAASDQGVSPTFVARCRWRWSDGS